MSCSSTVPPLPDNAAVLVPEDVPDNLCYLRTTRKARLIGTSSTWHSAGTLIEGQYLVTAAHNIYDSRWTRPFSVTVTCKSISGEVVRATLTRADIEQTREVSHYDRTFPTDYAFIKLPESLAVAHEVVLNRDIDLDDISRVEVAGYPGGVLRYGEGPITSRNRALSTFYYDIDTVKGMSGGPVWAGLSDGRLLLLGIHVTEGGARHVDAEMLRAFDAWQERVGG